MLLRLSLHFVRDANHSKVVVPVYGVMVLQVFLVRRVDLLHDLSPKRP